MLALDHFWDKNNNMVLLDDYLKIIEAKFTRREGIEKILKSTIGGVEIVDHPRFKQAIQMLEDIKFDYDQDTKILDLGSSVPFITFYFKMKYDCKVQCWDPNIRGTYNLEGIEGKYFNICDKHVFVNQEMSDSNIGKEEWDFISLTEVLEHVTCNLYTVRDKVVRGLKKGGYMLVSYPQGDILKGPYDVILRDLDPDGMHSHLREFSVDTAVKFISDLTIVDIQRTGPLKYVPKGSTQIIYRKE